MFTKKVILFAAGSMFAAGATLASNVSFGQRAVRWIADNMDFIGPISGLVNAVVRAPESNRNNPVMSFQTDKSSGSLDNFRAGNALQVAAYDARYGVTQAALSGTIDNSRSIVAQSSNQNTAGTLMSGGGAVQFGGQVGDNQSNLNALAKSFLRDAKGIDNSELWALLNSKGGSSGDFTTINVPSIAGNTLDKNSASAEIPQILAAATNGDPLASGTSTGGQAATGNGTAATAATATTQANAATTPGPSKVPLPGVLGLLMIGLASMVVGARARRN